MQDTDEDYTAVVTAAMLWDMLPAEAVPVLCGEAGVTPPGPDGAACELASSQARRDVIRPLLPWVEVLSVIAAEIEGIATIRPVAPPVLPIEHEALRALRDQFDMQAHDIILPAATAIISTLVGRGFLSVTARGQAATLDAFTGS